MSCFGGGRAPESSPFVYELGPDGFRPKKHRVALLIIDPQNDFVEDFGSLQVPGGLEDCRKIAEAVKIKGSVIDGIYVTLDTHQKMHIAHSAFWRDETGSQQPVPFTEISKADVASGKWKPLNPAQGKWVQHYVDNLERQKKFKLIIWPEHCLVGTRGFIVQEGLMNALLDWETRTNLSVNYVEKGNNAITEHYSALKAEVPRSDDPRSELNCAFINQLEKYDTIVVGGEALSHCVNFTVRDLAANVKNPKKIIVLTDGCSTITGFETASADFRKDMEELGVRFLSIKEAI